MLSASSKGYGTISISCSVRSALYCCRTASGDGWEKLFSERLYLSYMRNYGATVRIARFHNIFGPEGTWSGGKEKAPAAICRKVIETKDGGEIGYGETVCRPGRSSLSMSA